MVLADPGLLIVEPIEMDQKLHVAIEGQQRVFGQRMKGRQKNAGLQKPVLHGRSSRVSRRPIVAKTDRRTSRAASGRANSRANAAAPRARGRRRAPPAAAPA